MMPRIPNCTTHQSWPGVRRRRVSQPSIHLPRSVYLSAMKTPRPGLRRFSFSAKNSSFARRAAPPTRASAIGAVGPWRDEQRDVILRSRVGDNEANRNAIEEMSFAEIVADKEDQFV